MKKLMKVFTYYEIKFWNKIKKVAISTNDNIWAIVCQKIYRRMGALFEFRNRSRHTKLKFGQITTNDKFCINKTQFLSFVVK